MTTETKTNLTSYDIAKQIHSQMEPYDGVYYNMQLSKLVKSFVTIPFSMLLCRERNDYTLFFSQKQDINFYISELRETLDNRGSVVTIAEDENNPGVWNIWIKDDNDTFLYYFFDATNMVVDV